MTTDRCRLVLTWIVILAALALVASASAAQFRGSYAVTSITLAYASKVTTSQARASDGSTGTMTIALTAKFVSTKPGAARGIQTPEVAAQFICKPSCPTFAAPGTITYQQTYAPIGGTPVTCKGTQRVKLTGTVYVASSQKTTKTLDWRITDTKGANDLYALVRGSCALSSFFPVDPYDYAGFGTRVTKTASTLGAKTITLSFSNALKTPSYPFPTKGSNKATATVVLARKS